MEKQEFTIRLLGFVRSNKEGVYLELLDEYTIAIKGLNGFSYINVLWWCNLTDKEEYRNILECVKPYKGAPDKVGILTTRAPIRPNPIALSVMNVAKIENNRIYTDYIDAEDGTPIIDIKPYHPSSDRIRDVQVPEWCKHWPKWYEDSAGFDWEGEFVNAR